MVCSRMSACEVRIPRHFTNAGMDADDAAAEVSPGATFGPPGDEQLDEIRPSTELRRLW